MNTSAPVDDQGRLSAERSGCDFALDDHKLASTLTRKRQWENMPRRFSWLLLPCYEGAKRHDASNFHALFMSEWHDAATMNGSPDRLSDDDLQDIAWMRNLISRKCLGFQTLLQAILKRMVISTATSFRNNVALQA